jgi:hypothetical protein
MKRTAVILGVAAAMGVLAPTAVGSANHPGGLPVEKPGKVVKPSKPDRTLHAKKNGRTGQMTYRLGNTGLWME